MNDSELNNATPAATGAQAQANEKANTSPAPSVSAIPVEAPVVKGQDPRPRITLPGKDRMMSDFCMELGQVLAPCGIYLHGGVPAILNREAGTLEPCKPPHFRTWIENSVIPIKVSDEGEEQRTISGGDAAAVLVSDQFKLQLREAQRLHSVRLPVVRASGEVELLKDGYDRDAKILTCDKAPYRTDMRLDEAKNVLCGLLADFPFADESRSKAVAVAAMLTVYGLSLLPAKTIVPAFKFRGNQAGLGKGLLAQLAMVPVLGYAPTGVSAKDENEMRKLLFATAREGRPVLFLDNVTGRLASPSLESFITTSTVAGRVIGSSVSLTCHKQSVVFITGHGCTLNPDMARRTLISELFLAEAPASREIRDYLDEMKLLECRADILAALYALVREWSNAGRPKPTSRNPNFPGWSDVIGAIVEHAGFGCVCQATPAQPEDDQRQKDMARLAQLLFEKHQTEAVTFTALVQLCREDGLFKDILHTEVGKTDRTESTALGRLFRSYDGRMFAKGAQFVSIGTGHARRYAIRRMDQPAAA